MPVNYYEVLEISPSATAEEIRAAVTRQRRLWVRRQSSPDPDRRSDAEQRVRHIDQAEKTLLDAEARRGFDRELDRQRSPLPPPRSQAADRRSRPDAGPRQAGRTAADWLERARAYLDQGNTGAAARAAREATDLAADDPMAWFTYGQAHAADNRPDEAELGFAEAIRLEPDNAEFHRGLGEACLSRRKWRQAATGFERVLRIVPGDARALAGLGEAYVHTGNARQGLKLLRRAARERPDDPAVKVALASALHATAVEGLSQVDGGSVVAMSGRQVALLRRNARKIRRLQVPEPSIRALEDELRALLREARQPHWQPSFRKRYYLVPLAIAVVLMTIAPPGLDATGYQVFGVVLASAVVGLYVHRHRVPAWKVRRKDWTHRVTRKGM